MRTVSEIREFVSYRENTDVRQELLELCDHVGELQARVQQLERQALPAAQRLQPARSRRPGKCRLPIGRTVTIDIAQGQCHATGIVADAEYDDGWLYRVDVTGGDDCQTHRNAAGELWVCDFEISEVAST